MGIFKPNIKKMADDGNTKGLVHCMKKDKDWRIRRAAAVGLAKKPDLSSLEPLITALKDENTKVRNGAIVTLTTNLAFGLLAGPSSSDIQRAERLNDGQLLLKIITDLTKKNEQHEKAIKLLIENLKDANENVRISSAIILGLLRWEKAVPQLTKALNDSNEQVRKEATLALDKIKRLKTNPKEGDGLWIIKELYDLHFVPDNINDVYKY